MSLSNSSYVSNPLSFNLALKSGIIYRRHMDITLLYLLPCGRVIKDSNSGLTSYLDIFEFIFLEQTSQVTYQSFWIAGKVYYPKKGNFKGNIKILDPKGKIFSESPVEGQVFPGQVEITSFFNLLKFTQEGIYKVELYVNDKKIKNDNLAQFQVKKKQ